LILHEQAGNRAIRLTSEAQRFQAARVAAMDDEGDLDTDQPSLGYIEVDSTASEFSRRIRIVPAADAVYTYPFYYYRIVPALAETVVPTWPPFMFLVWKSLTQAIAEKEFRTDERWKSTYVFAKAQLDAMGQEEDKNLETETASCQPGLDDWAAANFGMVL